MTDTTTDEVKADGGPEDIRAQAVHLSSNLDTMAHFLVLLEKDPGTQAEGLEDVELADAVAQLQDVRARLAMVERELTTMLGKRLGKTTANLSDGRQFTVDRMADRKEWQHDEWQRDARRAVQQELEDFVSLEGTLVDTTTGEEKTLGQVLQEAMVRVELVHGSTAPRSRALKALGLYASDYCTSTPGGWRFNALKPTTKEDTTDA